LGKLTIYHSFILSNFKFCPLSWHFCSEANTNKIEKIQERVLRFIYNDYNSTYENLLIVSKLPTLKVRRLRTMAIEVYKKLDNMNEWYMVNLPNLFKYLPSLFNTFNCRDAFLQMFEIWELNLSSKSIVVHMKTC
jgi:hypothetical protein